MTTGSPRPGEEIRDDLTSIYMVAMLTTIVSHMGNRSHKVHVHMTLAVLTLCVIKSVRLSQGWGGSLHTHTHHVG